MLTGSFGVRLDLIRAALVILALLVAAPALAADRTPSSSMPLRAVERPLTLLEDHFALQPDVLVTKVGDTAWVGLFVGAGYGIDDDFEIGITLLRLTLSKDPSSGIDSPTGYLAYRLIDGPLELALKAELEIPVDDAVDFAASVPVRIHGGAWVAVTLEPAFYGSIASPGRYGARVPAELRVQATDQLSFGALAQLAFPSLDAGSGALLQFGGLAAYTLDRARAAFGELRISVFAKSLTVGDQTGVVAPYTADWTVLLDATFFLRSDPDETAPESPF